MKKLILSLLALALLSGVAQGAQTAGIWAPVTLTPAEALGFWTQAVDSVVVYARVGSGGTDERIGLATISTPPGATVYPDTLNYTRAIFIPPSGVYFVAGYGPAFYSVWHTHTVGTATKFVLPGTVDLSTRVTWADTSGYTAAGTFSTHTPTDVDNTLSASHGATSWLTAVGFSTFNPATDSVQPNTSTIDSMNVIRYIAAMAVLRWGGTPPGYDTSYATYYPPTGAANKDSIWVIGIKTAGGADTVLIGEWINDNVATVADFFIGRRP